MKKEIMEKTKLNFEESNHPSRGPGCPVRTSFIVLGAVLNMTSETALINFHLVHH